MEKVKKIKNKINKWNEIERGRKFSVHLFISLRIKLACNVFHC